MVNVGMVGCPVALVMRKVGERELCVLPFFSCQSVIDTPTRSGTGTMYTANMAANYRMQKRFSAPPHVISGS